MVGGSTNAIMDGRVEHVMMMAARAASAQAANQPVRREQSGNDEAAGPGRNRPSGVELGCPARLQGVALQCAQGAWVDIACAVV